MDFVLISDNLNLIGFIHHVSTLATNCWQQLPDLPFSLTELLPHETRDRARKQYKYGKIVDGKRKGPF